MIMFFDDVGDVRKRWLKSRNKRYTRRFVHVFRSAWDVGGTLYLFGDKVSFVASFQ